MVCRSACQPVVKQLIPNSEPVVPNGSATYEIDPLCQSPKPCFVRGVPLCTSPSQTFLRQFLCYDLRPCHSKTQEHTAFLTLRYLALSSMSFGIRSRLYRTTEHSVRLDAFHPRQRARLLLFPLYLLDFLLDSFIIRSLPKNKDAKIVNKYKDTPNT